ncbi:MAG: sugar transferase [Desulfobacterales bacterium]|nr:sugar transferase [Desulfobacterales bacterium]
MLQQQGYVLNTFLMVIDAVCVIASGYSAYFIMYRYHYGEWGMEPSIFIGSVMVVMFMNNYMMGRNELYGDVRPTSYIKLLWSVLKSVLVVFAIVSAGTFFLKDLNYSRGFLLIFVTLSLISISVFRVSLRLYIGLFAANFSHARRLLIVGDMDRGEIVSEILSKQLSWGHKIVGRISVGNEEKEDELCLGCLDNLTEILRSNTIDEVVFAINGDRSVNLSVYLDTCRKIGVPARILPAMWQSWGDGLTLEMCQGVPFLTISSDNIDATGILYKRILDIVGGIIGMLMLVIIYPFIAIAIKLDSSGPVLFKQKRMGQHGRIFDVYKFRTMCKDAEKQKEGLMDQNEMSGALFKLKDDPRITKVGHFLRKTSLDEFPQFINVIKGEMSLVGTRPPTVEEVEMYEMEHLKRISAKPGITGLWQVSGRNRIDDFEQVVSLDCKYLDQWRFADDLKILFKTVWVVFQRKGAM